MGYLIMYEYDDRSSEADSAPTYLRSSPYQSPEYIALAYVFGCYTARKHKMYVGSLIT